MIGLWIGVASILLVLLHHFVPKQKRVRKDLPLGSMGWPFIGETIGFLKSHKSNSMGTFLQQRFSRYGKVFKSHLFGHPTIVSCDLELNTFILHNEDKLFQTFYPKPVHDILGKLCLMLVSGDLHKKLRNVVLNFINKAKSNPQYPLYVNKLSVAMMKSWENQREVHFCKEAKEFTMSIMLKSLLNIEAEEPLALQILEDFIAFMKGLVSFPLYIPGLPYAKAIKAKARLLVTIRGIIEEKEKHIIKERENSGGIEGVAKADFLDEILLKGNLNTDETVSLIIDTLLAGYETTSGLLGLLIYFLAQSPSVLDSLKEEHLNLRRSKKDGGPLNWEDYKQMKVTSNVISEALRCGNLVKFVHRKALQDVTFKGYYIPAGWQVLPILLGTHLDPSLHENPTKFNPSRWEDKEVSNKVTPFGGGIRLCPGTELAKVESALFLHHLVLNYRWKLKEDDYPLSRPYLEFKRGLLLEIEPIILE